MKNVLLFCLVTVMIVSCHEPNQDEKKSPNIIYILVDDLGWKDTHAYGSTFYQTPNVDKLARKGMTFTNAYASAANCAPSRACLLSGKYPPRHGIYTVGSSERGSKEQRKLIPIPNKTILADSIVTIADELKKVGYITSAIGKWHIGIDPCTQGFDVNVGGTHQGHPASYFSPYKNEAITDGPEGEYLTDRLTNEALRFIERNKNEKFFLYLSYYTVHTPLQGKTDLIEKYEDLERTEGQNNPVYAAMIESMDKNVGRIMTTLDALDLSENTLVFFTSDNGGVTRISSQQPLRYGKGSYYEGGIRVPLIASWPGKIEPGSTCDVPVSNIDFYPSMLEVAGITEPLEKDLDGLSILPLLLGNTEFESARPVFWHFPVYLQSTNVEFEDGRDPYFRTRPGSAVRMGKWKLHEYFEKGEIELYNLESDPGEHQNLVKKYPDTAKILTEIIAEWRARTNAPVPYEYNPYYEKNPEDTGKELPNIIIILADDMGYGDVACLNESSKISTPNLDKLARQGIVFTDAHSNSAVCTPTRYGLLTGRYAWRSRLKSGVTWSYDKPVIEPNRTTIASLLKEHNYYTACIGKWHLGLDWARDSANNIDFKKSIENGPVANGFDYFFGITASLDIPPYFYIRNDRITATIIDTVAAMDGKKFWRKGPIGNDFKHIEVLPKLTEKAVYVINEQTKSNNPFFLYFPLPAPHTPILPSKEFQGKSGTNEYGDFVMMVDDVVGKIMSSLKENGIAENTLLFFTSDNGCSPMADFEELAILGHDPSFIFRGHKADIYEGGHRVPFIAAWPDKIKAGSISDEIICITDFLASCAAIVGDSLADDEGEDSYSLLPALLGKKIINPIREATVHHSIDGNFSIRKGNWKLEFCAGSGGWSYPRENKAIELGLPPVQLYNLKTDIAEENNIAAENPEIVESLTRLMQKYIDEGRSTPGISQQNTGQTKLFKTKSK